MSATRLLAAFPLLAVALCAPLLPAQVLRPVPSGRATAEVTLAYPPGAAPKDFVPLTIRIDYGQPFLRGRTLHIDSLVPYDKPWRTGANASTVLRTQVPLTIGAALLPKGDYVLFTLPTRDGWTLLVQRSVGQSTSDYDSANDIARVPLRRRALSESVEALTFWLIPLMEPGLPRGELRFAWGKQELSADWSVK